MAVRRVSQALGGYCPDLNSTARVPRALLPVPLRRCAGPVRWDADPRDDQIAIHHVAPSGAETGQSMSHPCPPPRRETSRGSPGPDTRHRFRTGSGRGGHSRGRGHRDRRDDLSQGPAALLPAGTAILIDARQWTTIRRDRPPLATSCQANRAIRSRYSNRAAGNGSSSGHAIKASKSGKLADPSVRLRQD